MAARKRPKKKKRSISFMSVAREVFVGIAIALSTSGVLWIAAKTTATVAALMALREDVDKLYSEVSDTKELAQDNRFKMDRVLEIVAKKKED